MADAKKKPGGLPGSIKQIAGRLPGQRRSSKRADGAGPDAATPAVAAAAAVARQPKQRPKPINVEQILAEMNPDYYKADFDMDRHLMEKVEQLDQPSINAFRTHKYRELQSVTARLSELVTKNKGKFLQELERVTTLETDLTRSTALCQKERKYIAHAEMSVKRDLGILYAYRKKTRMEALLLCAEALFIYKTARESIEKKLEHPKEAVEIWLRLKDNTDLYRTFNCVGAEAIEYIQDQRAVIEERLERTLKLQCSSSYQQEKYSNVIAAYKALDMYADAIDKVQYNFAVIIPSLVRSTIIKILGNGEEYRGMPFKEILRRVPLSLFEDCLVEVCRAVCRIMLIFSRIFGQHKKELRAASRGQESAPSTPVNTHRRTRSLTAASDTDSIISTTTQNGPAPPTTTAGGTTVPSSSSANGSTLTLTTAGADAAAGAFAPPPSGPPPGTPLLRNDSVDLNASLHAPPDPISKKFESTRERIWQDVQKQVTLMLASQEISTLKLSVFLRILGHIRRLVEIGEDFSKLSSPTLNETTRTRTLSYVLGHHRRTLERGKSFLEKDAWIAESVNANFNFLKLKEFAFLRKKKELSHGLSSSSLPDPAAASAAASAAGAAGAGGVGAAATAPLPKITVTVPLGPPSAATGPLSTAAASDVSGAAGAAPVAPRRERSPLERFQQDQDMFHTARNAPEEVDVALPDMDDDQVGVEASAMASEKAGEKAPSRTTVVHCSRSSLYFVRCFGRYMHMMDVLKPIAGEVFACLKELFDYYIYTVVSFFGDKAYLGLLEPKPRQLYNRLEAAIAERPKRDSAPSLVPTLPPGVTSASSSQLAADRLVFDGAALLEIGPPRINPDIADQLVPMTTLQGLPCRITGAESMMFLATAMRSLQKYLKERIPEDPIKSYFALTVEQTTLLKWYIYKSNALKLFSPNLAELANDMERMKWDIKEIRSQHSLYIENLDKALVTIKGRLSSFTEAMVPQFASNFIWTEILTQVNATIVDGFSLAKKCTNEGRALMQLDYRQLSLKIRGYTNVRFQSELVDDYIRAYYLNDAELEQWIEEHYKSYSTKQLFSLSNIGAVPRHNKQQLQRRIEELKGESVARPSLRQFVFQ